MVYLLEPIKRASIFLKNCRPPGSVTNLKFLTAPMWLESRGTARLTARPKLMEQQEQFKAGTPENPVCGSRSLMWYRAQMFESDDK
jgi:hypothetical protein